MSKIAFEWDRAKSESNVKKHGVSFSEAATVFYDENALVIADDDHSDNEDRFVILGLSTKLRILVVVHCYKDSDKIIRIISARKATKKEQKQYGV